MGRLIDIVGISDLYSLLLNKTDYKLYNVTSTDSEDTTNFRITIIIDDSKVDFNLVVPREIDNVYRYEGTPFIVNNTAMIRKAIKRYENDSLYFREEGVFITKDSISIDGDVMTHEDFLNSGIEIDLGNLSKAKMSFIYETTYETMTQVIKSYPTLDTTKLEELTNFDINYLTPKEVFNTYMKPGIRKLSYKISDRPNMIKKVQNLVNKFFTSQHANPIEGQDISILSHKYRVVFREQFDGPKLQLNYNKSFYGTICPLTTTENANVNYINSFSNNVELNETNNIDVKVLYDGDETTLTMKEFLSNKVLTPKSFDFDTELFNDTIDYTLEGKLYHSNYDEVSNFEHLIIRIPETLGISHHCYNNLGEEILVDHKSFINTRIICSESVNYEDRELDDIIQYNQYGNMFSIKKDIFLRDKTQYFIESEDGEFSKEASVIPMINSTDSTRIALGSHMLTQLVDIQDPDYQVVYTESGRNARIGKNLITAFLHIGSDYEDGITLREGILNEFAFEDSYTFLFKYDRFTFDSLTDDIYDHGIPKIGSKINSDGVIMLGSISPKVSFDTFKDSLSDITKPIVEYNTLNYDVTVTDVKIFANDSKMIPPSLLDITEYSKGKKLVVEVTVSYINKPQLGDKFTNLYGSKGVITRIIPDEDMYRLEDGTLIDCIMPPTSIIGRKGLSLLKVGFLMKVSNKIHEESTSVDDAKSKLADLYNNGTSPNSIKLEEVGNYYRIKSKCMEDRFTMDNLTRISQLYGVPIECKSTLYEGNRMIKTPIVVIPQYICRLNFIAEKRMSSSLPKNEKYKQSTVRVKQSGQKFGEQEVAGMLAQGVNPKGVISRLSSDKLDFIYQLILLGQGFEETN